MTTRASFSAQTGARRFSSPFPEAGALWILDAAGHQWCWTGEEWERFTDDDDEHVRDVAREKRAVAAARRAGRV